MITDAIIEFFLNPVSDQINTISLPDVELFTIPEGTFDVLISILRPLGYFLPVKFICQCMALLFSLDIFNILWALILRIKSFASVHSWL